MEEVIASRLILTNWETPCQKDQGKKKQVLYWNLA